MNGCAAAVRAAILREIEQRSTHLDASNDIREVTVTVKLNAGTTYVRGITYQEDRVWQSQPAAKMAHRTT